MRSIRTAPVNDSAKGLLYLQGHGFARKEQSRVHLHLTEEPCEKGEEKPGAPLPVVPA